jgi:hypothetical protein
VQSSPLEDSATRVALKQRELQEKAARAAKVDVDDNVLCFPGVGRVGPLKWIHDCLLCVFLLLFFLCFDKVSSSGGGRCQSCGRRVGAKGEVGCHAFLRCLLFTAALVVVMNGVVGPPSKLTVVCRQRSGESWMRRQSASNAKVRKRRTSPLSWFSAVVCCV